MRRSLHQDRQRARRTEVTARPEHSGPAEPTDPDRHISGSRGFLFPPFHTPLFSHLIPPSSTTAAISAFLCRCGMAFLTDHLLQTFRTALPSCSSSTTALFPAILCRCGSSLRKVQAKVAFHRHLPEPAEPAGTVSLSVNRMPSRWSTSCWKMTAV